MRRRIKLGRPILYVFALLALSALTVWVVLPVFAGAKEHSGPGIYGNLRYIQLAKERWLADGNTNEWPTATDLIALSSGKTVNEIMRPMYGEVYFINRTGAPPFACFPKESGRHRAGEMLVLASNKLVVVRQ